MKRSEENKRVLEDGERKGLNENRRGNWEDKHREKDQGRKGRGNSCTQGGGGGGPIQPLRGEGCKGETVSFITIQDAYHCIAVAH